MCVNTRLCQSKSFSWYQPEILQFSALVIIMIILNISPLTLYLSVPCKLIVFIHFIIMAIILSSTIFKGQLVPKSKHNIIKILSIVPILFNITKFASPLIGAPDIVLNLYWFQSQFDKEKHGVMALCHLFYLLQAYVAFFASAEHVLWSRGKRQENACTLYYFIQWITILWFQSDCIFHNLVNRMKAKLCTFLFRCVRYTCIESSIEPEKFNYILFLYF